MSSPFSFTLLPLAPPVRQASLTGARKDALQSPQCDLAEVLRWSCVHLLSDQQHRLPGLLGHAVDLRHNDLRQRASIHHKIDLLRAAANSARLLQSL